MNFDFRQFDGSSAWVRLKPTDWRSARYLIQDIRDLRLDSWNATKWVLGSVLCNSLQEGEPLHACEGAKPHELQVYILRLDNEALFPALLSSLRDGST
jgi:hypothetical protein